MPRARQDDVTPYVERLRALGFVEEVKVEPMPGRGAADYRLTVTTGRGRQNYLVQVRGGALGYPLVDHLRGQMRGGRDRWLFAAPHIPAPLGEYLTRQGIDWIDDTGNCHLELGRAGHTIHVEGRRPRRQAATQRPLGAPGHQVLLALLARPDLARGTVRAVAATAGTSKTLAAEVLARLRDEGDLVPATTRRTVPAPGRDRLLERWVIGYAAVVRPAWFAGRFRTQARDPEQLERLIADVLRGGPWALGGAAAAWKVAPHLHPDETVLHLPAIPPELTRRLRALPADDGNLTLLATRCPVAYEGIAPHTAHPLVVYAELLATRDERAADAAAELREKLLRR